MNHESPLPTNILRAEYSSDVLVDLLKALDIEYISLNPGATFRELHDSIVNYGGNRKPEIILCCHEEIAVDIAHGYNKVSSKPMAALVHNLIGLMHATMAIFNTWVDRAPLLVLGAAGPIAVEDRIVGTRIENHSVNFAELAQSFGLYGEGPIENPEDIRPALERAVRHVKEKKQLALIDLVTQPR